VAADCVDMTISATSPAPQSPALTEFDRAILIAKKQQDVSQAEGQSLVELISKSSVGASTGGINVYA
jgi:hypothetical protein